MTTVSVAEFKASVCDILLPAAEEGCRKARLVEEGCWNARFVEEGCRNVRLGAEKGCRKARLAAEE